MNLQVAPRENTFLLYTCSRIQGFNVARHSCHSNKLKKTQATLKQNHARHSCHSSIFEKMCSLRAPRTHFYSENAGERGGAATCSCTRSAFTHSMINTLSMHVGQWIDRGVAETTPRSKCWEHVGAHAVRIADGKVQ